MASLLFIIFFVELVVQLVNTIGAATINSLLWRIILKFPTSISAAFRERRAKQIEYLKVRQELKETSSQDEFAKWAKLRRKHDKMLEELEKTKTDLDATEAKFNRYLTTARLVSTRGLQWFLPFWYSREPMFWLPLGWFPFYVEWFASFPRAPLGSVSIVVWQWACTGVLTLVMETAVAVVALIAASRQEQQQKKVPVPAAGGEKKTAEKKATAAKA